jgi:hypothetical protein
MTKKSPPLPNGKINTLMQKRQLEKEWQHRLAKA